RHARTASQPRSARAPTPLRSACLGRGDLPRSAWLGGEPPAIVVHRAGRPARAGGPRRVPDTRSILWVDDEIDMWKPHLLFLEEKGFAVTPVANGDDAVSMVRGRSFDLVLLDENMPGKDGLQTLQEIRHVNPTLPIVMVTRNEAEEVMDQAIGRRADDYLLKPVNPTQILLAIR